MVTFNDFMKMLESGKQFVTATRLTDGVVPRVDFVDAGANGEGEDGFLVKKNRKGPAAMTGKLTYNEELQKYEIVQKSADTDAGASPIKVNAEHKTALGEILTASKAKIETLEKALVDAEDDAEATDLPEAVQAMVADLVGQFVAEKAKPPKGKIPPQFLQGGKKPADEDEDEKAKAKAKADKIKAAKKAEGEPDADAEPTPFDLGDLGVSGPLADIAKAMAEEAGDKMNDPEFAGLFRDGFAPMAALQAALDPTAATNVAMASVEKRMTANLAALETKIADQAKTIGEQKTQIDAIGVGFGSMPQVIRDGDTSGDQTPVKKNTGAIQLVAGQDISEAGMEFVQ